MTDPSGDARSPETVTCMLCGRLWPRTRSVNVERRQWVCGEPHHCHQYAQSVAAQSILAQQRKPTLWRRPAPSYANTTSDSSCNDPYPYPTTY